MTRTGVARGVPYPAEQGIRIWRATHCVFDPFAGSFRRRYRGVRQHQRSMEITRWIRSSAPPAAHNTRRAAARRRNARSARKSGNTFRRAGRPGRRRRRWRPGISTRTASTSPAVIGIGTQPSFAIGQRALLICTPDGNVLWDCISMLDAATIALINGLGGLQAIGISHPHFYTTMVDWSRAFGGVPIHLHADDQRWIMRPDPSRPLVERRDPQAPARRDAGPLRRPFSGRHRAALGQGRRRPRRVVLVRHRDGDDGPKIPRASCAAIRT